MEKFSGLYLPDGQPVYTQEYVASLRESKSDCFILAQKGAQERILAQDVDILICGGSRGGSKSFSLLLEGLKDAQKANFNALLLRKETGDLAGLVNDSYRVYSQYGEYHSSKDDTTWHFRNGGKLKFSYYDGSYLDFKERFQGRQYNFIGIDEITQCPYEKFKYLSTCNRNAHGLRNRIWGTCNPDPRSWVRLFIDWWIDADGYIDPARDGVIRYCYMDGDDVNNVVWGDTRHEVFEMCKEKIMRLWKPEYDDMGLDPEHTFIQSVTFVRADLSDNKKLLLSDPAYLARLGQQDEEQVMRDLLANWNFITGGDDLVSAQDLDAVFDNSCQLGDQVRRCTADIALEGGDNLVMSYKRNASRFAATARTPTGASA